MSHQINYCLLCPDHHLVRLMPYHGSREFPCLEIFTCTECGLGIANPMPNKEDLDKYYSGGLYYDKSLNPFNKEFFEFSLDLARSRLRIIENNIPAQETISRVIDIGAGNGAFGCLIANQSSNLEYDIVEPDRQVGLGSKNWVTNLYSSIEGVAENYYDLVLVCQVLEHVPNPVQFLEKISTMLVPGGYLYIDVPFKDYYFKEKVEPHVLFWTEESLTKALKSLGTEILLCDTYGMNWRKAKKFFSTRKFDKLTDPWNYTALLNRMSGRLLGSRPANEFSRFDADSRGGERQWLRCICKKSY
jgi:2-polyprenyl-3-methyl-5-hydroxy-6-metoxy-1,4-benzoquinol methylase